MPWPRWFSRQRDDEIDEEIASHLAMAIRDRIDRGETPAEARRRAVIEFGNPALAKETTRSVWTWTACEQLIADAQIGARILWRAPALSLTAILLIALVIGGNMPIFSMVHAVLTKPAPGIGADRLVTLGWVTDGEEHPASSYPNYLDILAASHAHSRAAVWPVRADHLRRQLRGAGRGGFGELLRYAQNPPDRRAHVHPSSMRVIVASPRRPRP